MFDPPVPADWERGAGLLLRDCAVLTRLDEFRPPAFTRLERAVGRDLARLLVGALAPRTPRSAVDLAA
jgi:hypothetical protein